MTPAFLKLCEKAFPEEAEKLAQVRIHDLGFGYDQFGAHQRAIQTAYYVCRILHRYYFRVSSQAHEPFPAHGKAIFAANHSGTIPLDGAMILTDLVANGLRDDFVRAVIDQFVGHLPFLGDVLRRIGQVIGTRRNFEHLLKHNQACLVFPEGSKGIVKPVYKKYQLQKFNRGFVELSIRHKTPIIPVAVVGAEEQMPIAFNIKRVGPIPFLPIPLLLPLLGPLAFLPLPVKYDIRYGKVFKFYEQFDDVSKTSPDAIEACVLEVKTEVHRMIEIVRVKKKEIF